MLSPLRNRDYRRLFTAQVFALLGAGVATIALSLLAHDLAGAQAGAILGAVLTIKMVCYVAAAPVAAALAANAPRKTLLVSLDVVRTGVALCLPFVSQPWQVYALMAVLYLASAAFTPAFQAMIPDVLPDEEEYTKALSLSRLAADLESVVSPILAAALLVFLSYNNLFAGAAVGFVVSALFVTSAALPAPRATRQRPFLARLTAGIDIFWRTPRLRGLVALALATASAGAMVFVNTVVMVQSVFAMPERATALALAAFGLGSIMAALALPRLLRRLADRTVMLAGALLAASCLALGPFTVVNYTALAGLWCVLGAGYSLTLTPIGRVLRRSSHAEERPALFAAQFGLSHACWLLAYPLAGFAGARFGVDAAFFLLACLCLAGLAAATALWPAQDAESLPHRHDDLPENHPHLKGETLHSHPFVIDDLHRRWPQQTARTE